MASDNDATADGTQAVERDGLSMTDLIDGMLAGVFTRHVGTLADALVGIRHLAAVPAEELTGDQQWESFAEAMKHFRRLDWPAFRVASLADAWGMQLRRIPDATESLIRCAFALGRVPAGAAAIDHLNARTTQIFGDDVPVLWSLLPEGDT